MNSNRDTVYGHCPHGNNMTLCDECDEIFEKKNPTPEWSENPMEKIKNQVASKEGYSYWNDMLFKVNGISCGLLMDKVAELYADYKCSHVIKYYEDVHTDHRRLVKELDTQLNGENGAKQASLCDIVAQVNKCTITEKWSSVGMPKDGTKIIRWNQVWKIPQVVFYNDKLSEFKDCVWITGDGSNSYPEETFTENSWMPVTIKKPVDIK